MKLKEFIVGRTEISNDIPQHLFDRVVVINDKIIEFGDDTRDIVVKEYDNLNDFISNHKEHPDIKYAIINKYGQICINYGESSNRNVYCRHSEVIQVLLEDFDTGKVTLTKKSCGSCGLEWKMDHSLNQIRH